MYAVTSTIQSWFAFVSQVRLLYLLQAPVILVAIYLLGKSFYQSKGKLPPGPRGLPFLGNIFQLPTKFQWLRFTEWEKEFGPIFSLNIAGSTIVVINSHEIAADLLDRRSDTYSDRPRLIVPNILTGDMFVGITGYGSLWRKLRRAGQEGLSIRASDKYQPIQEREAVILASDLIRDPECWEDHIRRSGASAVLSTIYAWPPIKSKDDPLVNRINEFMLRLFRAGLPGAHLVEVFPIMRWLPSWLAKWKRESLEWYRKDSEMFEGFIDGVSKTMVDGNYNPSFSASILEKKDQLGLSNKEAAWLAGGLFGAGAESTAATLSGFMLAMVLYPDVMRKAQREIDEVVGRDRLPTFADRPNLPYVRAVIKEVLRWRPVGPLGVPRRNIKDDWYKGYFIPKGTVVIANIWGMNHNSDLYPDSDEFRPERFLDETDGKTEVAPANTHGQGHVSYGFGRRICMGMHLANQALFIDLAILLWSVDIAKAVDADGKEIVPSRTASIDDGLVVRPAPFKCSIVARSKDVSTEIEMARERAS